LKEMKGRFDVTQNGDHTSEICHVSAATEARRVSFSCCVTTTGVLARYCSMVSIGGVDTGKSEMKKKLRINLKREWR